MSTFSLTGVLQFSPSLVDGAFRRADAVSAQLALTDGTTAGKADSYWASALTIANGATTTIDLRSLTFTALGASGTVSLASVKFLAVINTSANVTIAAAPGGTNGWDQFGPTTIGQGGSVSVYSPTTGLPTTASLKTISFTNNGTSTVKTGNTTSGSAAVTNIGSTTGLAAGMLVSGTGVPANTTIVAVTSSTAVQLSANATATGTGVSLTYQWPSAVVNVYAAGVAV